MKKKDKKKIIEENSEQAQKIACAKKTSIGGQALMEGSTKFRLDKTPLPVR